MSKMRLKLKLGTKSRTKRQRKHDFGKFKDVNILTKYQQEVPSKLASSASNKTQTLDQAAEAYSSSLKAAADDILGFTGSWKKPWIYDGMLKLTDERKETKRQLSSTPHLKPAYNQLTHQIRYTKDSLATMKTRAMKTVTNLNGIRITENHAAFTKTMKELTGGVTVQSKSTMIKDKAGSVLTNEDDIRRRWGEYCSDLYNYDIKPDNSVLDELWTGQE
jgi:hypothetical protein